jgi:hypothetical protein
MSLVGVAIEIRGNEIKQSNLGIITAACNDETTDVCALIFDNSAEYNKEILGKFGVRKIIKISSGQIDVNLRSDLKAL